MKDGMCFKLKKGQFNLFRVIIDNGHRHETNYEQY